MAEGWSFLVRELVFQMALISIGMVFVAVVLIYVSRYYIYKPKLVTSLHIISNLLSILAMLFVFSASISAVIELMYREAIYLMFLFFVFLGISVTVTKDSSSA